MKRVFVEKFNVVNSFADFENPLSVGNGDFAFTCDITGLQTFCGEYDKIPLCTMSDKIWAQREVTAPKPYKAYVRASDGKTIEYMSDVDSAAYAAYRLNAYKFDLFKLEFTFDGKPLELGCVTDINQVLDLYGGKIISKFIYRGAPVEVTTSVARNCDCLNIKVSTVLEGLGIRLYFRAPSPELCGGGEPDDRYILTDCGVERRGDDFGYKLFIKGDMPRDGLVFDCGRGGELGISADGKFGGESDLSAYFERAVAPATDDYELCRRYVLSLYLLKVNSLGVYPPAETGVTCNSWYGKFHLEMHLWHVLGVIKAGLYEYVLPSLEWYLTIADGMRERAAAQGYKGMRPPKMTSPRGDDAPSEIGCFLIWQVPHLFVMLDEIYKRDKTALDFKAFAPVLCGFADFLADFWYLKDGEYHLDSPLIPANENVEKYRDTPIFETCYTLHAFRLFKEWVKRLNIDYDFTKIDDIMKRHVKPTVRRGAYETYNGCSETYERYNTDHPMTIGGYSFFISGIMDAAAVKKSLDKILACWDFDSAWGWDFPMLAMAANNAGERELAESILKMPANKNTYLKNGHNPQRPNDSLPVYLPGNGAFVLAVLDIFNAIK